MDNGYNDSVSMIMAIMTVYESLYNGCNVMIIV